MSRAVISLWSLGGPALAPVAVTLLSQRMLAPGVRCLVAPLR